MTEIKQQLEHAQTKLLQLRVAQFNNHPHTNADVEKNISFWKAEVQRLQSILSPNKFFNDADSNSTQAGS